MQRKRESRSGDSAKFPRLQSAWGDQYGWGKGADGGFVEGTAILISKATEFFSTFLLVNEHENAEKSDFIGLFWQIVV